MPETRECSQSKSNFRQQNQFPFLKRQILAAAKKKKEHLGGFDSTGDFFSCKFVTSFAAAETKGDFAVTKMILSL